jgi:hypothetical protein
MDTQVPAPTAVADTLPMDNPTMSPTNAPTPADTPDTISANTVVNIPPAAVPTIPAPTIDHSIQDIPFPDKTITKLALSKIYQIEYTFEKSTKPGLLDITAVSNFATKLDTKSYHWTNMPEIYSNFLSRILFCLELLKVLCKAETEE